MLFSACLAADMGCAPARAQEVRPATAGLQAGGTGRLTYWGFEVYDAALWVSPGFRQADFAGHAFALELAYLRGFKAKAIAERSLHEMQRQAAIAPETAAQWTAALAACFPDVQRGDKVMGVNRPGGGVTFWTNGRQTGEIRDPVFAKLFFGIWLAPETSEPRLRAALLAGTAP